ncbi:MAG: PSD1 and planctomycete cytochrome C domain-containing protein [Pirellulaceae bacterium]|jgi:hypothetical protein|nr:PSD1 and planctomycete cytochrome C domain-containing protein [Pirellulaceae bacterium]
MTWISRLIAPVVWGLTACFSASLLTAADDAGVEFFERHVRPVLVKKCLRCHGPTKHESELRVDSREALLKGGERGPAIDLEDPEKSPLLLAIGRQGDLEMPPDAGLPGEAIAAVRRWLERGAPWPADAKLVSAAESHWAFRPIRRPAVPTDQATGELAANSIDTFILRRLRASNLSLSPPADRRTLIRRLHFDLLGVPPTPAEVESFVDGSAPDAYERLVDRLLASPRYGERWGRHWLDVARYADNKGYVFFEDKKYPWAYAYRDYVIEALNADTPYDQFIREQLAADYAMSANSAEDSAEESRRALRAMGFLTIGAHFMNNTHDMIDDRIDVVMRGLMGLTVTCARCHEHKYDPIPQSDYYALYGVFRSSAEPLVPPLFERPPETEEYQKYAAGLEERLGKLHDFIEARHSELVGGARQRADEYLLAAHRVRNHPPTDDFMLLTDKGALNPTMILRWRIYLQETEQAEDPIWLPWHAVADIADEQFADEAGQVFESLARQPAAIHPLLAAAWGESPPGSRVELAKLYAKLLQQAGDRWTKHVAENPGAERLPDDAWDQLREVFYGPQAPPDVPKVLGWGFLSLLPDRPTQNEFKELLKAVEKWSTETAGAPPRAMVLEDSPDLYEPRVFLRGNPNRLGDRIKRGFLSMFDPGRQPFERGSGRLELANRIASRDNPLTARVEVNRAWMHFVGSSLVTTPGDFGVRSDPPSHPELLDWLASEFIDNGWSRKWLHRRIALSAVYRQQSRLRADGVEVDADNRLLWRMNSRRLDFESLRDHLLAAADSLDSRRGGPAEQLFGAKVVPRRSVYGFIDRMDVSPLLTTFDFPNPIASSAARVDTTTAPQALYMMNGQFVVEISKRIGARDDLRSLPTAERIDRLFEILYCRPATESERAVIARVLGDSPQEDRWRLVTHGLLLANEFVFVN